MKYFKLLAISIIAVMGMLVVMPTDEAKAWATEQSAKAVCSNNEAKISWSFTNAHNTGYPLPGTNKEGADMSITATDKRTGKVYGPFVVHPQQTITKTIMTGVDKVNSNDIELNLKWTHWNLPVYQNREAIHSTATNSDGSKTVTKYTFEEYRIKNNLTHAQLASHFNNDNRTATYNATEKCVIPHNTPTDFTPKLVCNVVDGEAKYIVKIAYNDGTEADYSPAHNSEMEDGKAVTVKATYDDGIYGTKTIKKKTNKASDCTPAEVVELCTISGKETLEADDPNCKETVKATKTVKMCEVAGKTNLTADDSNCAAEVLPNTGPAAVIAGFVGSGALGTAIRSWSISKKNLKNALIR